MNNLIEFIFLKSISFALLCIYSATSASTNITAQYRRVWPTDRSDQSRSVSQELMTGESVKTLAESAPETYIKRYLCITSFPCVRTWMVRYMTTLLQVGASSLILIILQTRVNQAQLAFEKYTHQAGKMKIWFYTGFLVLFNDKHCADGKLQWSSYENESVILILYTNVECTYSCPSFQRRLLMDLESVKTSMLPVV